MTLRVCSEPACDKPHRARGLCSTHYNQSCQTRQQRHPRAATLCVVCRRPVDREVRRTSKYLATCSSQCRTLVQFGATGRGYDWTYDATRRATAAGATVIEHITRDTVFARDGWTCYLCSTPVHLGDCFALDSATVDHVVPLSRGGQHTMANVRTCCLSCNSAKQDRLAA